MGIIQTVRKYHILYTDLFCPIAPVLTCCADEWGNSGQSQLQGHILANAGHPIGQHKQQVLPWGGDVAVRGGIGCDGTSSCASCQHHLALVHVVAVSGPSHTVQHDTVNARDTRVLDGEVLAVSEVCWC